MTLTDTEKLAYLTTAKIAASIDDAVLFDYAAEKLPFSELSIDMARELLDKACDHLSLAVLKRIFEVWVSDRDLTLLGGFAVFASLRSTTRSLSDYLIRDCQRLSGKLTFSTSEKPNAAIIAKAARHGFEIFHDILSAYAERHSAKLTGLELRRALEASLKHSDFQLFRYIIDELCREQQPEPIAASTLQSCLATACGHFSTAELEYVFLQLPKLTTELNQAVDSESLLIEAAKTNTASSLQLIYREVVAVTRSVPKLTGALRAAAIDKNSAVSFCLIELQQLAATVKNALEWTDDADEIRRLLYALQNQPQNSTTRKL